MILCCEQYNQHVVVSRLIASIHALIASRLRPGISLYVVIEIGAAVRSCLAMYISARRYAVARSCWLVYTCCRCPTRQNFVAFGFPGSLAWLFSVLA